MSASRHAAVQYRRVSESEGKRADTMQKLFALRPRNAEELDIDREVSRDRLLFVLYEL